MQQTLLADTTPSVVDRFGRRLRYLRLSVTSVCNLSCTYCNPVQGCVSQHVHRLSWDDLAFALAVSVEDLGVEALRITGGEPTVRPGLASWVAEVRGRLALRDVAMTTNGILLSKMAGELSRVGIDRVNVSLDSFDAERFRRLTRGGSLARVLEGIAAAKENFERVKLNCVLLRGENIDELPRFAEFSHTQGIEVRFIELMPIADDKSYFREHFISVEEVKQRFAEQGIHLVPGGGNSTGYGPAATWSVEGSRARLGFISQMSDTKCLSCNKLRLTSDGALKPCLLAPEEIEVLPAILSRNRMAVADAFRHQFLIRAERYGYEAAVAGSLGRAMQATGG